MDSNNSRPTNASNASSRPFSAPTAMRAIVCAACEHRSVLSAEAYGFAKLYEMSRMKTATIERQGDQLIVKFQSAILFDVDKTELKDDARTELADLARVLKDYPDTVLVIEGHTDSTGSAAHNKKLSEQRARSVIEVLAADGVDRLRLTSKGWGEDKPLQTNATAEGRAQNRRVEVHIAPNQELKKADAENAKKTS